MNRLFSPAPMWQHKGLAFVRIVTGLFLVFHGWEIFEKAKMQEYATWDSLGRFLSPSLMAYAGKAAELLAGVLLTLGLFTRIACIVLAATMLYISFFIGNGRIWYEDQHPFLFVLLGLVFFFTGPGAASMDDWLFRKKGERDRK